MQRRFVVNKRTKLPLPEESPVPAEFETWEMYVERRKREKAEELQRWCDRNVDAVAEICRPEHYKEALLLLRKRFCEETGARDPLKEES